MCLVNCGNGIKRSSVNFRLLHVLDGMQDSSPIPPIDICLQNNLYHIIILYDFGCS